MGSKRYSRQDNGRFRRATLENTFGLSVEVCPSCRRMSPHQAGSEPPETCHACGGVLRPVSECSCCGARITFLGDRWKGDDGLTACTDASAPLGAHKPKDPIAPPPHVRETATPASLSGDPELAGLIIADCSCGGTYAAPEGGNEWDALEKAHAQHVADALAPDGEGSDLD
jgi:hypothetical protein